MIGLRRPMILCPALTALGSLERSAPVEAILFLQPWLKKLDTRVTAIEQRLATIERRLDALEDARKATGQGGGKTGTGKEP